MMVNGQIVAQNAIIDVRLAATNSVGTVAPEVLKTGSSSGVAQGCCLVGATCSLSADA